MAAFLHPVPGTDGVLEPGAVADVAPGEGVAGTQSVDVALENDFAAAGAGCRAEVDDVIGYGDRLGLVLHDEHGVAFIA